jgi:hypothetical protein
MSYHIEWVKKPYLLSGAIEKKTIDSVRLTERVAKEWFPAKVNEWLAI